MASPALEEGRTLCGTVVRRAEILKQAVDGLRALSDAGRLFAREGEWLC